MDENACPNAVAERAASGSFGAEHKKATLGQVRRPRLFGQGGPTVAALQSASSISTYWTCDSTVIIWAAARTGGPLQKYQRVQHKGEHYEIHLDAAWGGRAARRFGRCCHRCAGLCG